MKKGSLIILISMFGFLTVISSLYAQTVVLPLTADWVNKDGSGFAGEVFFAVLKRDLPDPENRMRPFKRALSEYQNKKHDCFLGGDEKVILDYLQIKVIASDPFLVASFVVYTLKTQPKISAKKELEGKRVGIQQGVKRETLGLEGIQVTFDEAGVEANIKKLKAGRIDMVVDLYPARRGVYRDLHHDSKLSFYTITDKLHCHPSEENQAFLEKFNLGLLSIKKDGTYQNILEKYYTLIN